MENFLGKKIYFVSAYQIEHTDLARKEITKPISPFKFPLSKKNCFPQDTKHAHTIRTLFAKSVLKAKKKNQIDQKEYNFNSNYFKLISWLKSWEFKGKNLPFFGKLDNIKRLFRRTFAWKLFFLAQEILQSISIENSGGGGRNFLFQKAKWFRKKIISNTFSSDTLLWEPQ